MIEKHNISDLFNPNGCLNQSAIAKFIDKQLDEVELQRVISHLDACPLCKDAVEGITGVGTGQFMEDMKILRTAFYASSPEKDKKHRLRLISIISAAASIVIVLGVLFLYQRIRLNADDSIAQSVETSEEAKEKTSAGEESGPLIEAAQPSRMERKKTQVRKSESEVRTPVMEMDEEAVPASEPVTDTLYAEMELHTYDQAVVPAIAEQPMESSEDQSVTFDINAAATASGKARSKSVINTGFAKKSDVQEVRTALPTQQAVFVSDQKPIFRGGDIDEFVDYLQDQMNKSGLPLKRADTDSILLSFVVDTLGRPVNIKLLNQIDPETEKEIIRQINSSPDWLPGKENGIMINVGYTILLRIPPEHAK